MKQLITGFAILTAALFLVPEEADARSYARKAVGRCGSCGSTLYAYYTHVGYDSCRRPVYRYITRPCTNRHHSYGHSSRYGYNPYYGRSYGNSCNSHYRRSGFSITIRR